VTPDSRFDRYLGGDKSALTEPEKRGLILFIGKASCSECHNGRNLADNKFHVLGRAPNEADDVGRYAVSKDEKDRGAFKTPTLRNVELTAPYTHNGVLRSLEEVIEFYNEGGGEAKNKSDLILKLELTRQEKTDLIAFLKSLTGRQPQVEIPQIPGDN
jgi:cytochrome c peroxidase